MIFVTSVLLQHHEADEIIFKYLPALPLMALYARYWEKTDVYSIWEEPHKPRWATDALGSKNLVRFCDYGLDRAHFCAQRDPYRVIFYAHRCCWKLANVPIVNDPLVMLRFAF